MMPWVWLSHDNRQLGQGQVKSSFTVLGEKYARAVKFCAHAQPFTLPAASVAEIDELLGQCDGVLLTGSPSNIHASRYGQSIEQIDLPRDEQRDELTLNLVQACLDQSIPLLAICRGLQEMNVALGGSLHQQVHQQPGLLDHREAKDLPFDEQYGLAHEVRFTPGSNLARWAGADQAMVNSLHGQGIDRLADRLQAIAHAPDGLVEAVEVRQASSFALGVQWHPEWQCQEHVLYRHIFQAFGQACRDRQVRRLRPNASPAMALS